jgi:hypothetical protein
MNANFLWVTFEKVELNIGKLRENIGLLSKQNPCKF